MERLLTGKRWERANKIAPLVDGSAGHISNGKGVKTDCSKARAGLAGEKKARPVMDVPGRAQA